MPVPGPGYAITARVEVPASASAAGDLTVAVGRVGGVVTAFDVVEGAGRVLVVDISCNARDEPHGPVRCAVALQAPAVRMPLSAALQRLDTLRTAAQGIARAMR